MRLSIILLLVSLRCQTAYHIQFHPPNSSTTYIPFTPRHHNSASFVTARQQYGCMSYQSINQNLYSAHSRYLLRGAYIPLPYFPIISRKRPFQNPIHNGFFLMLMLLSGDIHVNPGPINGYSTYSSSPPPLLLLLLLLLLLPLPLLLLLILVLLLLLLLLPRAATIIHMLTQPITLLLSKSYPDPSSSPYLPPRLNSKHHPP